MGGRILVVVWIGASVAWAAPGGAFAFANPDAVPGRTPRSLEGARADPALFPARRSVPDVDFGAPRPPARKTAPGEFTSPSLPHRVFTSQPALAEALELAHASEELAQVTSVGHAQQVLADVLGRLAVGANQARIGALQATVQALADAAAPKRERAWPAVRAAVLGSTLAWLVETGRIE